MPLLQENNSKPCGTDLSDRHLCLDAVPQTGMLITSLDLDLTVDCNMRCVYCFKEKRQETMPKRIAFDAVVWLLYASGTARELFVNFMGGEPLLQFDLIKELVPFGKRRALQHGKSIQFGVTTNCTLVSDEVVAFWKQWGMGFHTSVDGIPAIQDCNRPLATGEPSSPLVEDAVPKILAYRSNTTARCTITPESVEHVLDNYKYFRSLGYTKIAMVPSDGKDWDKQSIHRFSDQFMRVADILIDEFRNGIFVDVKGIHEYMKSPKRENRERFQCGAGRGMALVDVHGNLWPCHRWNKQSEGAWKIGNIYEHFDEDARKSLQNGCPDEFIPERCGECEALNMCHGGCPAENLEESGSPFTMSTNKCDLMVALAKAGKYTYNILHGEKNSTFMEHYCSEETGCQKAVEHE